jgi:hypothetical protein
MYWEVNGGAFGAQTEKNFTFLDPEPPDLGQGVLERDGGRHAIWGSAPGGSGSEPRESARRGGGSGGRIPWVVQFQ